MTRRRYAIVGLIVLMVIWGSTFVVTQATVAEIPPLTLRMLRFLVAALVLVPIALGQMAGGIVAMAGM